MRLIVQRVDHARVFVNRKIQSAITHGLLVLCGIEHGDTMQDIEWLAGKLCRLRIFNDINGVMNLSVDEAGGEILLVSQFTLHASTKKGNRPSYIRAMEPIEAEALFMEFVNKVKDNTSRPVNTGAFGSHMCIDLVNNGPVTIMIDSRLRE